MPLDDFVLQESSAHTRILRKWIDCVFRLRQQDRQHALEFVEGWNGTRIVMASSIPLLLSAVLAIVWSVKGSGIQDGFAIAGFMLTAGSCKLNYYKEC
jgi:hypothetical protein